MATLICDGCDTTTTTWSGWNGWFSATITASSSNDIVWTAWTASGTTTTNYVYGAAPEDPAAVERRREADRQADALLRSFLTPEQEQTWEKEKHFDVIVEGGERPARHYRIAKGTHGNIKRLENGRVVETLCVQPSRVPVSDVHLAQLLHLTHDEDGLRRKAGINRVAA